MMARLSHYRIDGELGRGGMGVVYRAHDERLQRPVAIKVLADAIAADPRRRAGILTEARASSVLAHPVITTVHEVGEDGDTLFIVMELVAGRTLREMLTEGPVDLETIAKIGADVAGALAAAHARGIIHGDIKPENVMVQPDGRVRLLDFGIARQLTIETGAMTAVLDGSAIRSTTLTSLRSGTLAYMAPELLSGAAGDGRSDLFSLGVLLYEAVSRRRPFSGETPAALIADILGGTPPPLDVAASSTPQTLAVCVRRLLEKLPQARYQAALEVAGELASLVRDLEISAFLPRAVAGKRAVAVLPFTLLTSTRDDEYLSGALADALINHLSAQPALLVRPTSTVMRYAKRTIDPLAAGRELNVDVVIDGSIQKSDRRLRVHVQARDVRDGSTLGSARHESDLVDLFGLQDAVAQTIAAALGVARPSAERAAAPTHQNAAAYELLLRAGERLSRANRWDTRTAIDMLESAVAVDPRFVDAWARLAEARTLMGVIFDPGGQWLRAAQGAVLKALALDAHNAQAHSARGRILWTPANGFKHRVALRALATALRLNPGCHDARVWQGLIFFHLGMKDDAKTSLTTALAANPDDGFAHTFLSQTLMFSGDYDGANEFANRALAIDPANLYTNLFSPMISLYRGQFADVAARIKRAVDVVGPDPMLDSYQALALAKQGHEQKSLKMLQKALRSRTRLHTHHAMHTSAAAYAVLGKKARAVALLTKAATTGFPDYPAFRDDPHFKSLHRYPPFLQLMAALRKECAGYQRDFGAAAVNPSAGSPIQAG